MNPKQHADRLQHLLSLIQMLGEALADNDDWYGSDPGPQIGVRGMAGMHGAIQVIASLAGDHCIELMGHLEGVQPSCSA